MSYYQDICKKCKRLVHIHIINGEKIIKNSCDCYHQDSNFKQEKNHDAPSTTVLINNDKIIPIDYKNYKLPSNSVDAHIGCGGLLTFDRKETKVLQRQDGSVIKGKDGNPIVREKNLYLCNKCYELVNRIICPSYDEFVIQGRIRVPWWELKKIRKKYGVE